MTENDLTTLYCIIDDFYNRFIKTNIGKNSLCQYYGKRGPKRKMNIPEVMTLNILRIILRVNDLKTFHKLAKQHYFSYFPDLPNYENFLKATNKSTIFIANFLQYLLYINQQNNNEQEFYIDSTPISVCENRYIFSHKVMKGIAERGKTTKGWFYGLKLHGVCTQTGTILKLLFRPGNEHDSKAFNKATKDLIGVIIADAGYLLKEEDLKIMFESARIPFVATRKNMKRLMSKKQGVLLRKRNCIENVWSVLKKNYQLIYHQARSVKGMFRHFFYSLASFLLNRLNKNLYNLCLNNLNIGKLEF